MLTQESQRKDSVNQSLTHELASYAQAQQQAQQQTGTSATHPLCLPEYPFCLSACPFSLPEYTVCLPEYPFSLLECHHIVVQAPAMSYLLWPVYLLPTC